MHAGTNKVALASDIAIRTGHIIIIRRTDSEACSMSESNASVTAHSASTQQVTCTHRSINQILQLAIYIYMYTQRVVAVGDTSLSQNIAIFLIYGNPTFDYIGT